MRVMLDEQVCDIQASTIGDALSAVAATAEIQGRVVVEVTVDGVKWTHEQLASEEMLAGSAEEVSLISAELSDLVHQTLTDASEALLEADAYQREAAESLQSDQRADAMAKLGEALGIWLAVHEAVVKSAHAAKLDLDAMKVGDGSMMDCIDQLNEHLSELRTTLQASDTVALSDSLMYELPQAVALWREAIDVMKEQVEQGREK